MHPADRLPAQPHSTCLVRWEFLFFSLKKKKTTIYFCLCWVFTATLGLSSVAASRGFFSLQCAGLLIAVASCCGAWALEHSLRSCWVGAQLLHGMWDLPGLGTEPVSPHTLRRTLNHWTAREALLLIFSTLKECLKRIVVFALRLGSSHS